MRTANAQESNQLLIIQSQALFVIQYLTYKSKNDNAKCCHDVFLSELKVLGVYNSQSLAYF